MAKIRDLTGYKYEKLTVLRHDGNEGGHAYWLCACECGNFIRVCSSELCRKRKHSRVKSCGCMRRPHGHNTRNVRSKTYSSWYAMCQRVRYVKGKYYHLYGGRGIKVCERWRRFENFLADMGERPLGKTLDRIDSDGHYEPNNCRWATPKEQAANRRQKHG